jgi:anti-sigma factor RsiW
MNEFDYKTLLEKRWRHKLTAAEEASMHAWLAQHPESRADWDLETQLSEALEKLPNAPVPSNFTARVLQAVEREAALPRRSANGKPWFMRVLRLRATAAVASVALVLFVVTHHQHTEANRAELVQGVKVVAGVSSLPSPEILQDFDTIRQLPASTGPDSELIALMK